MDVSEKLQLIRALEERERFVAKRGGRVAVTSVVIAAVVLILMIGGARRELSRVNSQRQAAQKALGDSKKELAATEERLAAVKRQTDEALRNLQSVGSQDNARVVEYAVDNLLYASAAAAQTKAPSGNAVNPAAAKTARAEAIKQLFDQTPAVRVKAYSALLPQYADDPTLVPQILAAAKENPSNANGIYNALVVLSHMKASTLKPYRAEIDALTEQAQRIGPRVADRAGTLKSRVPKD